MERMILDEKRKEPMLKSPCLLKDLRQMVRRSALLCLSLISIAFVSGPADANLQISSEAYGCTIVMAARNGLVLAGNNEDRNHSQTIVTFIPARTALAIQTCAGSDIR